MSGLAYPVTWEEMRIQGANSVFGMVETILLWVVICSACCFHWQRERLALSWQYEDIKFDVWRLNEVEERNEKLWM